MTVFFKMQHLLRNAYGKACQENLNTTSEAIQSEIVAILEEFDISWAKFE